MAWWKTKNATGSNEKELPIALGKVSSVPNSNREITIDTTITRDVLNSLSSASNKFEAIDIIVDKVPDGKMALNIYTTFTNRGGELQFFNAKTGKRVKKYDTEYRTFCERVGANNGSGLDGIMDSLARSAYTRGGMAFEVVVMDDLSDIQDVVVIDPSTFSKFLWIDAENRYALYQTRDDNKEVDLYTGNFTWFPYQPKVGRPEGTLKFEPAILAVQSYYQLTTDAISLMNRVTYPRYLTTIDGEKVLEQASPQEKATFESRNELFENVFDTVATQLAVAGRDSDIITFDTTKTEIIGGSNGTGMDIRAWIEGLDPIICNAFGLEKVMLNRQSGGSYALGTAQYKAFVDSITGTSKDLKRANENIANMWARVKGYPILAKFVPKPLEWEEMDKKWQAKLKQLEYNRRAEEYGYQDKDTATQSANIGESAASQDSQGMYEYLTKNFSATSTTESGVE